MFTIQQAEEFVAWLDSLKDKHAQIRIVARLRHVEAGNLGDWKAISGKICELRIHVGPGYRIYFLRRRRRIIVLLNAGNKATQAKDIRRAQKIAEELEEDHDQD